MHIQYTCTSCAEYLIFPLFPFFQMKGPPQVCNKCSQIFPSRNKLFEHIKVTGHALRVEPSAVGGATAQADMPSGKKGKKKKGRK